jgi:hypothetical protein
VRPLLSGEVNVLRPGYGVFHPTPLAELDQLLESAGLPLVAAVSALHSLPSQLLQLTVLLADHAGRWRARCTAAGADRRRLERCEAAGACAHRWCCCAAALHHTLGQAPLAQIIREAMARHVANVIQDQRMRLAWRWAEYTAHLLQVEAE